MKISVVLACYNGEKRILRQLESIRNQTRTVDEVILIDDCSKDRTAKIVQEYIHSNGLANWTVSMNETNRGWKASFIQALKAATGDLLFPCDQDDEWDKQKIERMTGIMESRPDIDLLACDYSLCYETGAVSLHKYKKKPSEKKGTVCPYVFSSRFFQNPSPGCTYAIRKTFFDQVKDLWFPEAPHDEFLWLLAAMRGRAWFLNESLMTIHRYGSNASDIRYKDIPLQQENLQYIQSMLECMDRYAISLRNTINPVNLDLISRAGIWCSKRQNLMETRNPILWLAMVPYWKYYNSFRNCLSDLCLILFGSFRRT